MTLEINKWDRYGLLTIKEELQEIVRPSWQKKRKFLCKCDCWNEKEVILQSLRNWNTQSCWCYKNKIAAESNTKHWKSKKRIYKIYRAILTRCNNKKTKRYKDYWGRWIKCEWESFEDFYADMWASYEEWLSIDRINNDWNYSKENCRWATPKQQSNNTRRSININIRFYIKKYRKDILKNLYFWIEWNWQRKSMIEWCNILWISQSVVTSRVSVMWWTYLEALWLEKRKKNKKSISIICN